ncbi:MAG: enoyl-CoA hydratase/isomerase family protein [Trueperaceae bacterium]|nr:enoyl-CoA hydratase/isomerase family protein [Trueperaceae bacterium]
MSDDPNGTDETHGAGDPGELADNTVFEHLRLETDEGVAFLTLDREEALNALSGEMLLELGMAIELVEADIDVRALVVSGAGRGFCAGADLAGFADLDDAFSGREAALAGQDVMSSLAALPIPTVAALHGFAAGGGLELALACDLRVAAPGTRLGLPETTRGLIPGYGGTQRLPRLIGEARALDLILTGRLVPAEEALSLGLVSRLADDPVAEAEALARGMLRSAPVALGLAKEAVVRGMDGTLPQGLEVEADLFGLVVTTDDSAEGVRSFLEKRDPEFEGR